MKSKSWGTGHGARGTGTASQDATIRPDGSVSFRSPGFVFVHAMLRNLRQVLAFPRAPCPVSRAPLLLFLLFAALPALAQSGRIQVEVLVFAYASPETGSALAPGDADPGYSGMLLGDGGALYSALPREALKLGGANDALARHARTRALVHVGWQQDAGSTRAVRLRGRESIRSSDPERGTLATELPELDGDISLRFGRGVEAHVDALLRVATRDSAGRPSGEQRFRLNSKRIMNYGELHYLDHPALGVIVRVDQVGDEAVSSEQEQ